MIDLVRPFRVELEDRVGYLTFLKGVRKGEEDLRDAFSAAIKAIRGSGEYKTINDNYFEVDIYGDEGV